MSRLCFSSVLLLFVHRSANADYIVYTMYSDSHCKVGLKGEQFEEGTCYHFIEQLGGWFGNLDDNMIYKLECDWLTDSVVGVQYYWPQDMLHASVNDPNASVNAESDKAVCDDSLPEGSPGAPTGKRIPRKNGVCVEFAPPRFAPWSYQVQCVKGKKDLRGDFGNLVPYPDANVIRNEPGHPEHGQMITSECAICTKKNSVSIAPHNEQLCEESPQMLCPKKWDPVTKTGQTWRMPCLNLKYQHSGSMSDGALSTSTSRYKAHMVIGLDRDGMLRHDWDWCCAPNAHTNNEACYRECLNEEDCKDLRPGLLTSQGKECNVKKEPWLGDLRTKCGTCAVDKNGLNTWKAEPEVMGFPWGTFYKKNEDCWLSQEDAECFNDRAAFIYYGHNICCFDPQDPNSTCGKVDVWFSLMALFGFLIFCVLPVLFLVWRYHKKLEYQHLA